MFNKAEERHTEQQRNSDRLADRLIDACIHKRVGEAGWLLQKKGISPNIVRVYNIPVTSTAMSPLAHELLQLLHQAKARFDLHDGNDWSLVFIAAAINRVEAIRHLVQLGARLDLALP